MATVLLVVIYIAYIGLGIPDSLFGAAWPAIYREFDLPVSYASFVTALVSGGTIISSLVSAMIIHRFGTAKVTAVSTSMTALALLGFSFSGNMIWLCFFSIPLGLGAGAVDTALNNYVAVHYNASQMSFLHCFYGVGVSLSPYLMSAALKGNNNWNRGYRIMFCFQALIAAITIFSLPLWKKIRQQEQKSSSVVSEERVVKITDMLKNRTLRQSMMVFVGSCAIESVCLNWGSTFLVNSKGATPDRAAKLITLYFLGVTLGRFLSGVVSGKLSSLKIVLLGEGITMAAILLVFGSSSPLSAGIGLLLIGLGNGPVFPNMTYLAPVFFGSDVSQSYIGLQMSASYVSILSSPVLFGLIAQHWSTDYFAHFLSAAYVITLAASILLRRTSRRPSSL